MPHRPHKRAGGGGDEDVVGLASLVRKRGTRGPPPAATTAVLAAHAASVGASEPEIRLAPAPRRVAAAERREKAAVETVVVRHTDARELSLNGMLAAQQARATALAQEAASVNARARGSELGALPGAERAGSAPAGATFSPPASLAQLQTEAQAVARSLCESDATTSESKIAAWRAVAEGAAHLRRAPAALTAEEVPVCALIEVQALSAQRQLLAAAGELKAAIRLLPDLLAAARVCTQNMALMRTVRDALRLTASWQAECGNRRDAALNVEKAYRIHCYIEARSGSAKTAPVAAPAHSVAQPPVGSAAAASASAAAPVAWPEFEDDDTSAPAVAARAVGDLMFDDDAKALTDLLNAAALHNSQSARDALWTPLPGVGITCAIACITCKKPDALRRVLSSVDAAKAADSLLNQVDCSGRNAVSHAAALGELPALTLVLNTVAAAWRDSMPLGVISLELLRLQPDLWRTLKPDVQRELSSFVEGGWSSRSAVAVPPPSDASAVWKLLFAAAPAPATGPGA